MKFSKWPKARRTGPYVPTGDKFYDAVRNSNPVFNFPPVRTLMDMSDDEIAALEREYGCKVKR